jgi:TonB family protein
MNPDADENRPSLSRYLLISLLLHFLLFLVLIGFAYLNSIEVPTETRITWVRLGGGVSEKEGLPFKKSEALPQTTIQEQKKASFEQPPPPKEPPLPKKEEKKPEGVEKEKVVVEDKTKKEKKPPPKEIPEKKPEGKQDTRINDALRKINQDLKDRTLIPEAAQVKEGATGDPQGSPGGDNSECSQYSARVKQRIVGNWIRLTGGNKPPRPPKIHAMINSSGQVTSTQFLQKSGDLSLDSSAMRAIENSSPLPPPPENCEIALRGGITVQFGR